MQLTARMAQALAMTAHELTTNAAKYGALSHSGGRIDVRWAVERRDERRHLKLVWREEGGAAPDPGSRRGFGLEVIERMLPYTLGGTAKVNFGSRGIDCRVSFPLERV